jgi:hypothetical protein
MLPCLCKLLQRTSVRSSADNHSKLHTVQYQMKCHGLVVSTSASYSGGTGLKSRHGDRLLGAFPFPWIS